jgi:hypothetical protein
MWPNGEDTGELEIKDLHHRSGASCVRYVLGCLEAVEGWITELAMCNDSTED